MIDLLKKCHKCGEDKPLGMFHRLKKSPDGRNGVCASCVCANMKQRYASNRGRGRAIALNSYRKHRERILEGLRSRSPEQMAKVNRRRREQYDPQQARDMHLARMQDPAYRAKCRRRGDRYDKAYPERHRARWMVRTAVSRGKMKRGPCAHCGSTINIQGHHEDYSKPLEVIWLCAGCHHTVHRHEREQGHG